MALLRGYENSSQETACVVDLKLDLSYRRFIGLSMDDAVWVPIVFTKNRERMIEHDSVTELFNQVLGMANERNLLLGEHFRVDGRLIQAWAGQKSFVRKDGGDEGDGGNFKSEKHGNDTHESTTDAAARLYRKGNSASELRYMGHALSDNRYGLIANALVTSADGHAEYEAAQVMVGDARQVKDKLGAGIRRPMD